jgi:hypothetical protein
MDNENVVARRNQIKITIMNLKQEDSYESYIAKFQELAVESSFREEDLLVMFINGLKPKTKFEVQTKEPKTLNEAYKIASRYEQVLKKAKGTEEKRQRVNYVKTWNSSRNQPKKQYNKQFKPRNQNCRKCGKQGHYANECRSDTIAIK